MIQENFSEWYHQILEDAEILDSRYKIKGMPIYRGWGLFIIKTMQRELERMLEEDGHEDVLFPVLIPADVLGKETEHIAGFESQVFWVTHAGSNELERKLALRPTSETPIYDMFSLWIRSHTDLPLKVHQSCSVYRYETKHTRPLIRGREFLWNEGHSAHESLDDAEKNIDAIKKIYSILIQEFLCIPFITDRRPDWDKFPGAHYSLAFDTLMPNGKTLQIATVHNLGQNFSKVFDITFETEKGTHEHVYQTSYGPSFGRLLAALISIHSDKKGLILPPQVAPIQVILIPILFKESEKKRILEYTSKIKSRLEKLGVRVKIDDGEGRPGAKFYYWEMKGVPLRLEVGPRDLKGKKITIVRRDTAKKSEIDFDGIEDVSNILTDIKNNMREKAEKKFRDSFYEVKTTEEIKEYLDKGIVTAGWCGNKECAEEIEGYGNILCVTDDSGICAVCGKGGNEIRVGKSY